MKSLFCFVVLIAAASLASAAEHRLEVLKEAPPADGVSEEVLKQMSPTGFRVIRGEKRTVCDLWLCKEWKAKKGFKPTPELLYPFEKGQLIGLLRFTRRGNEFRDQRISKGVYTLRFGLQPIDGNHEGTSPTRDFVMLVQAEVDPSAKPMEFKKLLELSCKAAGSSHPAMMCLQKVANPKAKAPAIRHNDEHDWWIAVLQGQLVVDGKKSKLPLELIVAGHANE